MKLINFFIEVFCVVAFLTLGSLMMLVSMHILPMEDALIKVQALYESTSESFQLGISGILFIVIGLLLSKKVIKQNQRAEGFFSVESDAGLVTIAYSAIDELVAKILKRYEVVKKFTSSCHFIAGRLEIKIMIEVVSGWDLGELTLNIKRDVEEKVLKMLRSQTSVVIDINVSKIEEEALELIGNK